MNYFDCRDSKSAVMTYDINLVVKVIPESNFKCWDFYHDAGEGPSTECILLLFCVSLYAIEKEMFAIAITCMGKPSIASAFSASIASIAAAASCEAAVVVVAMMGVDTIVLVRDCVTCVPKPADNVAVVPAPRTKPTLEL